MEKRVDPSFLTSTMGDAQGQEDGSITPRSSILLRRSPTSSRRCGSMRRTDCRIGGASPVSMWWRSLFVLFRSSVVSARTSTYYVSNSRNLSFSHGVRPGPQFPANCRSISCFSSSSRALLSLHFSDSP